MDYLYSVAILISLFVILASSFNLIIGYGGLISIAHPIFYGLGAYTSALLSRDLGVPVPLGHAGGDRRADRAVDRALVALVAHLRRLSADRQYRLPAGHDRADQELALHRRRERRLQHPAFPRADRSARRPMSRWPSQWRSASSLLVRRIAHSDYGRAISAMRDDEVAFAALGRDAKWMKISLFALGLRHRRTRWRALCPLLPLRDGRAIRDPDVVDDPDDGRCRRHADALRPRGRRHSAAGSCRRRSRSSICRRRCLGRCRACCSPGWC